MQLDAGNLNVNLNRELSRMFTGQVSGKWIPEIRIFQNFQQFVLPGGGREKDRWMIDRRQRPKTNWVGSTV